MASIHYADAMLGRVLDALESGPNCDNTIVVLWSDHGWHLGEKQHWQKYTAWRACTRVPLVIRIPSGVAPIGTKAGTICKKPVSLLSLFPTLTEVAGLPAKNDIDSPSLVPLVKDPDASWPHVSITHLGVPGSFGLSTEQWRYIHYAGGDEELYQIDRDPYEWNNLAQDAVHAKKLAELRLLSPKTFAPLIPPKVESLIALTWHPSGEHPAPASKPAGGLVDVFFINRRAVPVELFTLAPHEKRKSHGVIAVGAMICHRTKPGEVWHVAAPNSDKSIGYLIVGDRNAQAVIPMSRDE